MEDQSSIELRRPRRAVVTGERVKTIVLLLIFGVSLYLLYDMGRAFTASLADDHNQRITFLNDSGEATSSTTGTAGVNASGSTNETRVEATVFFPYAARPMRLKAVKQLVPATTDKRAIVANLIEVLQSPPPAENLASPLPAGTKLLAIFIAGKDLYVDLSSDIYLKHSGDTVACYATLQALTNTLTSLDFVERVKILVAGKERLTLMGHFDLMDFWTYDQEVVEG